MKYLEGVYEMLRVGNDSINHRQAVLFVDAVCVPFFVVLYDIVPILSGGAGGGGGGGGYAARNPRTWRGIFVCSEFF